MTHPFKTQHEFIDAEGGYDGWGAVAVADFDGDGRPEFVTGGKGGGFYHLYDWTPAGWFRSVITDEFSPNVGAATADLDGDGRPEIVCGEWGGRLLWLDAGNDVHTPWQVHPVFDGLDDPHDVLAGDIDDDGRDEVIVREKDGRLMVFSVPDDPHSEWTPEIIAEHLPGDGTLLTRTEPNGPMHIFTNAGWFENGAGWQQHPLVSDELDWHPETRIAAADLDGNVAIVITESEIGQARLAVLRSTKSGSPWTADILLARDLDLRALHSLQLADLDGDGELEIFTAEMENGKTDGESSQPRWWALDREPDGAWSRHVLLDMNLGTHSAAVADFDGDGRPEIVGKVWRANAVNGNEGHNHVDWVRFLD